MLETAVGNPYDKSTKQAIYKVQVHEKVTAVQQQIPSN